MDISSLRLSSEESDFPLTGDEMERYSRQMTLAGVGLEGQTRLKKSRVLVVGAGGIGSPVLMYLAGMGIGTLGIVDPDFVDKTNLHRQVLHSTSGIGSKKVESAKAFIESLNPNVKVEAVFDSIRQDNVLSIVKNFDLVLDGSDNPLCRYLVSDACCALKKPLISGACVGFEGQITLLCSGASGCYRCLFPECPKGSAVMSCSANGVIGPAPGLTGCIMASEAFKFICGLGEESLLCKKMLIFDLRRASFKVVKIRGRREGCPACGQEPLDLATYNYEEFVGLGACEVALPSEKELDWSEIPKDSPHVFLDVRPKVQHDVISFPGVELEPVRSIEDSSPEELKAKFAHFEGKKVLVFCRSGNTSRPAALKLIEAGFDAVSMKGGLIGYKKMRGGDFPLLK